MSNLLETATAIAPSHWAPYFINGDSSGMDETDIKQADSFADWLGGNIVSCEDAGFYWHHDAMQFGALAADCQTYTALVELTPVLFRKEKGGAVIAVFPTLPAARGECTCYAHIGQHSGMSPDYFHDTAPASPEESRALKLELMRAGYRLKEYKRRAAWMEQKRQQAEARP